MRSKRGGGRLVKHSSADGWLLPMCLLRCAWIHRKQLVTMQHVPMRGLQCMCNPHAWAHAGLCFEAAPCFMLGISRACYVWQCTASKTRSV